MERPTFSEALDQLDEAMRKGVQSFVEWFSETWPVSREEWEGELPKGDWFDGYKAGVESARGALDMFLDEHPYG